jgi:pyridoxal phosphate enzyme (YggS family)
MLDAIIQHIETTVGDACNRVGRDPGEIQIVAVTKTVEPAKINEAIACGLAVIGENRVQEYLEKRPFLAPHAFHMVGSLQRNKVKYIAGIAELIHSLDSIDLAKEIDVQSEKLGKVTDVLLEVNTSGEVTKHGVHPDTVVTTVGTLLDFRNIRVCGLMTIGALSDDPDLARSCFRRLARLRDTLKSEFPGQGFPHLSMGMSGDYVQAVEEGATLIRLGAAIFGRRNY